MLCKSSHGINTIQNMYFSLSIPFFLLFIYFFIVLPKLKKAANDFFWNRRHLMPDCCCISVQCADKSSHIKPRTGVKNNLYSTYEKAKRKEIP